MNKQMDMGLIGGLKHASVAMLPSFVPNFYDKSEDAGSEKISLNKNSIQLIQNV